ncbi:MAG: hypothetical protein HYV63_32340, partial [Candidatus Schekmanbacteria bacterium]|nr:hypothetical protein [Candidatus Schekmanbacteria bacterium]
MSDRTNWRREAWVSGAASSAWMTLLAGSAAAAGPVTAISGHAYLSGAADHAGIAVSLSQVYVGISGPAQAAMLIALAAVLAVAWRRGAGRRARLAVAGGIGLIMVSGGGRIPRCRCPGRTPRDRYRRERRFFVLASSRRGGLFAGLLQPSLPERRIRGGAAHRGDR